MTTVSPFSQTIVSGNHPTLADLLGDLRQDLSAGAGFVAHEAVVVGTVAECGHEDVGDRLAHNALADHQRHWGSINPSA
ncbi:hypothetical protein [Nocardia sp. NPDC048505]|uniref:hypothetical protein n=1 Tax=unclassified Nocardia TaxID=2637762 RepID=UPI0033EA10A6